MAEQALGLGLTAIPMAIQHGGKVTQPMKQKYNQARGRAPQEDRDIHDNRAMEDRGYVLRRRKDVGSDEEIVETVRHRGQVLDSRPRRPKYARKASSADNLRYAAGGAAGGAAAGAYANRGRDNRRDSYSDSEGSVPPRSRVRAKSASGRSKKKRSSSSSSSSTASSELDSSTEEEKQMRHMQRKKWITAGLASVATIHAASKVYTSIEAHDKRIIDVQTGKLSPEEARKKQKAARWQDAAAIAIAALGIKGALSEWHEVQEEHAEHKEMMEKKEEHHKKRMEHERRMRALKKGDGYYKGRDGNWYYDGPEPQSSDKNRQGFARSSSRYDQRMIEDTPRGQKLLEYDSYNDKDYSRRARSQAGYRDRRETRDSSSSPQRLLPPLPPPPPLNKRYGDDGEDRNEDYILATRRSRRTRSPQRSPERSPQRRGTSQSRRRRGDSRRRGSSPAASSSSTKPSKRQQEAQQKRDLNDDELGAKNRKWEKPRHTMQDFGVDIAEEILEQL